jgi:hypothetical protein
MHPLKDGTAALDDIRAQTPDDGVQIRYSRVLAVLALRPELGDKLQSMGYNLALGLATNCAEALLLALVLLNSRATGVWERAHLTALAGLFAGAADEEDESGGVRDRAETRLRRGSVHRAAQASVGRIR